MKTINKNLDYYLNLPYTVEVIHDTSDAAEPVWFAKVKELPGCMTEADSFEEAGQLIQDALVSWLEVALARDIPIPEPMTESEFSGKFLVRIPKSLHRDLVNAASREGTSLNQFVGVTLGRAVGQRM